MANKVEARMKLLDYLERKEYLKTSNVRSALEKVDRADFVRTSDRDFAYDDTPLPIGQGQTISAPHMVAMMLEELKLEESDNLLEIGSGCGYHAAIASRIVSKVTTVERIKYIYELAFANLTNFKNIELINGDGSLGYKPNSPYQKIMVTCGSPKIPKPLVEQLDLGGLMVIPVGGRVVQELLTVKRKEEGIEVKRRPGVAFVPMIGANGFEN